MGSKSVQFNDIQWTLFQLAEEVILLECPQNTAIEAVHASTTYLLTLIGDHLKDIVPAYHSIALFTSWPIEQVREHLEGKMAKPSKQLEGNRTIELPICYELGLDLKWVASETALSESEIINRHLNGLYRAIFIGFTPGFIYADGLDPALACPRLDKPRTAVPKGSVGIGGHQTGIYSLTSPGGWNIIGRTPAPLFDKQKHPPMSMDVGTLFTFQRISRNEFEKWAS